MQVVHFVVTVFIRTQSPDTSRLSGVFLSSGQRAVVLGSRAHGGTHFENPCSTGFPCSPPLHPISLMSPCCLFVQGNGWFDRRLPHSRLSLVALQSFSSGWSYPLVDGTQLQGSACVTCLQPTMAPHCRRWAHILGGAPRPPVLVTAPLAAPLLCQPHPQPRPLFLSDPSLLGSSLTSMALSRDILPFFFCRPVLEPQGQAPLPNTQALRRLEAAVVTPLSSAPQYIRQHRPAPLSMEDALQEVKEEL